MSKLSLKTQNTRGGTPLYKPDLGYIVSFCDNERNRIVTDAFDGFGNTYKRRNFTKITISNDLHTFTFNSFDELIKSLLPTNKNKLQ